MSPKVNDGRSSKLMLDFSRVRNPVGISNRSNGSPPFSDSSTGTGSSCFEMSYFPHSMQTCRSDSPNSDASSNSMESVSHHLVSAEIILAVHGLLYTILIYVFFRSQSNSEASSNSTDSAHVVSRFSDRPI